LWLGRVCVTRAIALGERLISHLIKSSNGVHVGVREPLDLPEVERALPFFSSYGCGLVECVCRLTPVRLEIASVAPVCMVRLLLVGVRVTRTLPLVESHVSLFLALWLGRVCVTRAIALGERLISLLIKSSNGVHVGVREPLDLPEVERALPFYSSHG